jgi:hypothetical protein
VINENGFLKHDFLTSENSVVIEFGKLFQIYTKISNKLVGMLLRARKYKLLNFDGEMLYQGRDDATLITLYK